MKRNAGKQKKHPRGTLTITITGRAKSGKSFLATYLGVNLLLNGHRVFMGEEVVAGSTTVLGEIMNKMAREKQPILIRTKTDPKAK